MPKPIFNLLRDGTTQGFLYSFLNCREQTRLNYVEGWTPRATSFPLAFGTCFHLALAQPDDWSKPYRQLHCPANPTPVERQGIDKLLGMVSTVLPFYNDWWSAHNSNLRPVLAERVFKEPGPLNIPLTGRWDAIVATPKNGHKTIKIDKKNFSTKSEDLWLVETKTKGSIDKDGIRLWLPHDIQTMLYSTTMQSYFGVQPAGVIYNVVRRPALIQRKDESLKSYLDRIRLDIKKRPDWYFYRWEVSFSPGDVTKWQNQYLSPLLMEVRQWWQVLESGQKDTVAQLCLLNPGQLLVNHSRSPYFNLITRGSTYGLYRRKVPYLELLEV